MGNARAEEILIKARTLRNLGYYSEAIKLLHDNLIENANQVQLLTLLAHLYLLNGQQRDCSETIERARKIDPNNDTIVWQEARLLLRQDKVSSAIEILQNRLHTSPNDIEGLVILGECFRVQGNFNKCLHYINLAITIDPSYAEAYVNRGLLKLSKKKTDAALVDFEIAHALKPDLKKLWDLLISLYITRKQYSVAISALVNMVETDPAHEQNITHFRQCLQFVDDSNLALMTCQKVIKLLPDNEVIHIIMGIAHTKLGAYEEANKCFNNAIGINPKSVEAHVNLGKILIIQNKLLAASKVFITATHIQPDFPEAYYNLGKVYMLQNKPDKAATVFIDALTLNPNFYEALVHLGNAHKALGRLESAIDNYQKAISLYPSKSLAWVSMADTLERYNQLDALENCLNKASATVDNITGSLLLIKAKLALRKNVPKTANQILDTLEINELSSGYKRDYYFLKAKCSDKLRDFDAAFDNFNQMNALAMSSYEYEYYKPDLFLNGLDEKLSLINKITEKPLNRNIKHDGKFAPVFMMGFPRSGTTLLKTVLNAHPGVQVADETTALYQAKCFLSEKGYTDSHYDFVTDNISSQARAVYEAGLRASLKRQQEDCMIIDKLPLNYLELPLIHLLYPNPKIIFSIRHPLDCILSCWMQNFKLNKAMAIMCDLNKTVEFYSKSMEIFSKYREHYRPTLHSIKYENLISSFSDEINHVLQFLNLEQIDLKNLKKMSSDSEFIKTPSYADVMKPLYTDSIHRWLDYQKYINKHIVHLKPWIKEFDYEVES